PGGPRRGDTGATEVTRADLTRGDISRPPGRHPGGHDREAVDRATAARETSRPTVLHRDAVVPVDDRTDRLPRIPAGPPPEPAGPPDRRGGRVPDDLDDDHTMSVIGTPDELPPLDEDEDRPRRRFGFGRARRPEPEDDYDDDLDDEYDDDQDDDEDDEDASPAREWLVMASQLAIGAIGGAALWLGFQWLWRQYPPVALAVALVVIAALVWVVRRIRRSDDMQTTVVTVLVGLFVTVSPAALLLVSQ
ncbi:MAG TPA: hypothetical protein VGD67_12620, partial [Pseudonocardiaceae bacterium]